MADQKLTALPAATDLGDTDLLYVVDGVGGTPASKKITGADLSRAYVAYAPAPSGGDDRAAIQAAIDATSAAGGGTVQLRAGTYLINSRKGDEGTKHAVEVKTGVRLVGAGIGATVIAVGGDLPSDTPVLWVPSAATDVEFGWFELDGNIARLPAGTAGNVEDEGIDAIAVERLFIHDVYIHHMGTDAIDLDGCDGFVIENVRAWDNGGNGVHAVGGSSNGVISKVDSRRNGHERFANAQPSPAEDACGIDVRGSDIIVTNCMSLNDVRGFQMHAGNRVTWTACAAKDSGTDVAPQPGMRVRGSTGNNGVSIVGCLFRQRSGASASEGIIVSGQRGTLIQGCRFESCSRGVELQGDAGDVSVTGCQFRIGSHAVIVTGHLAGRGWQVTNCRAFQLGNAAVRVEASTSGTISGNVFRRDVSTQVIAVMGNVGTISGLRIQGNDLTGGTLRLFGSPGATQIVDNSFAGFDDLTGAGHIIRNNVIDGAFIADGAA